MLKDKEFYPTKSSEVTFSAMGGNFVYKAFSQKNIRKEHVLPLFRAAHEEVLRIENKYTEFKASEINRINELAGVSKCEVDTETMFLLEKSTTFYQLSKGLFDITYSSRNKLWRDSFQKKIGLLEKLKLQALVDFSLVKINSKNKTVFLPKKGMRIGFGGIGKGYAVDKAFQFLKKEGLINFSVNGSGDMRVHSEEGAPRPWKIGIRNPFQKNLNISAGLIQVKNGSVSTSGSYIQKNECDNTGRDHHILSQYENINEAPPVSCTIFSEKCLDSDVWATITMACDIKRGLKILNEHSIYGVLIDHSGKSHLSSRALVSFQ